MQPAAIIVGDFLYIDGGQVVFQHNNSVLDYQPGKLPVIPSAIEPLLINHSEQHILYRPDKRLDESDSGSELNIKDCACRKWRSAMG